MLLVVAIGLGFTYFILGWISNNVSAVSKTSSLGRILMANY
jgi:hypothetical protein